MVSSGNYDVVIDGVTVLVYTMEDEADAHPSFGELALLYSRPRAASVICATGGKLWRLHRSSFRDVATRSSAQQLTKTLRAVEVLHLHPDPDPDPDPDPPPDHLPQP